MDSLLREELPTIVSNGAFGQNLKYLSFDLDKDHVGQDQYMSTVLFGTVTTSDELQHRVVIKLKLRDEKMRIQFKIDFQFHNEITMYERIIPFLFECHRSMAGVGNWPTFARFFYGRNKCGEFFERDLIVLENVNPLGFRLSEDRPFLDYDHLVIALQALAKFHGLSYTAKYKDPDRFQKIIMDIRDTQFDLDGQWLFKNNALSRFGKRGVDQLLERSVTFIGTMSTCDD
uniref:ACYPI001427 protein n=1 Tax=Acyrthosiphon pisum TaxID=7029 RepID=C4WXP0_ACYPI|nr:ACYPI001427 [Acyrthosiphon pisum]